MANEFIDRREFTANPVFALLDPPTWTRLEPQTSSGDPRPGIQARVHDPLWLLGRQWQLGEFEGEDAGTPLTVRVVTNTSQIDRWAPGDATDARPFGRAGQELLEPLVEREPATRHSPGLRPRAEAGAALLASLEEAGLDQFRDEITTQCPLDLDATHHPDGEHASLDDQWRRLARLLRGRALADGELICQAFEDAGGLPNWLNPANDADADALLALLASWAVWYRAETSPPPGEADAWSGQWFEYRFRVGAAAATFDAPSHTGGAIDWHTFDRAPAGGALPEPDNGPPAPPEERRIHAVLATPLRYPGMPADRLWEFEDAKVNLGAVDAEPWDLARLLVAEFALTYGNDWLTVPVDVPFGSLTTIESVLYTTTFGEHFVVRPTNEVSPDGRWRMFTITTAAGATSPGLLVPPGAVAVQDGPAVEEVLYLRDEMANLVWAIERVVQGPSGAGRDRSREHSNPIPHDQGPVAQAALDYLLQTGVPARWIPYLPKSSGYRAIELVQGRMSSPDGSPGEPLGQLLNRADMQELRDAEIPREGIVVRRQPSMTRKPDGGYERWITRRVGVGRGEGASQLAFDVALPRRPTPNG